MSEKNGIFINVILVTLSQKLSSSPLFIFNARFRLALLEVRDYCICINTGKPGHIIFPDRVDSINSTCVKLIHTSIHKNNKTNKLLTTN